MKAFKTIISIVFIVGTVAVIIYDSQTRNEKPTSQDTSKADSTSHRHLKK